MKENILDDDIAYLDFNIAYDVKSEEDIDIYCTELIGLEYSDNQDIQKIRHDMTSYKILSDIFYAIWEYQNEKPFMFVLQEDYVDKAYRDSYYTYYSGKLYTHSRFSKRVILFCDTFNDRNFFDLNPKELNKKLVGSIVLRPLNIQVIGRTLLNPKYFMPSNSFVKTAEYNFTVFGKRLTVDAYPFSMQDGEVTTCAENTLVNLLDYYSTKYPDYHYLLPSEINKIALENGFERSVPSKGLAPEVISRVLCEARFSPLLYSSYKIDMEKMRRILFYYIESGLPIAVGFNDFLEAHSITVIGHGFYKKSKDSILSKTYGEFDGKSKSTTWFCDVANLVDEYYIMDDNLRPYHSVKYFSFENEQEVKQFITTEKIQLYKNDYIFSNFISENETDGIDMKKIESVIVPLSKKMYLEAADAVDIFRSLLASGKYSIKNALSNLNKEINQENLNRIKKVICLETLGNKDYPVIIRVYLASARGYTRFKDETLSDIYKGFYNSVVYPKFIWVCELSTIETFNNNKIIGEIVLDATATPLQPLDSVILVNYPYQIYLRKPNDSNGYLNDQKKGYNFEQFVYVKEWQLLKPYYSLDPPNKKK